MLQNSLKSKLLKPFRAISAILLLSGCATHQVIVSTNPVGTKNEVPVGIGRGESGALYLFGMQMEGDDSVRTAIENAIKGTQAETLSNIAVDMNCTCLLSPFLFRSCRTLVRGTLIKYLPDATYGFARTDNHPPPSSKDAEKDILSK